MVFHLFPNSSILANLSLLAAAASFVDALRRLLPLDVTLLSPVRLLARRLLLLLLLLLALVGDRGVPDLWRLALPRLVLLASSTLEEILL